MARRPSRRDDAVTTEPVSDFEPEDAFVGGMDLATAITIFTFLFILFGIGVTYYELKDKYDVGVEEGFRYPDRINSSGSDDGGGDDGGEEDVEEDGEEGGDEEGEEGGDEGGEEGDEEGGDEGDDDSGF